MKKLRAKFDLWLGSAALILMVFVVVLQVVCRYSGNPLAWPEEVARWTMIWVTFAGASYAFKNGGLIRVEFFIKKLFSPKIQKIINIMDISLLSILFAYLAYSSILYMRLTIRKHQVYNVTRVPYAIIIAALLLGGILCVIFSARQIIQIAAQKVEAGRTEGKE